MTNHLVERLQEHLRYCTKWEDVPISEVIDRITDLENALQSIAYYDGQLDAAEAARSWRTASAALSKVARPESKP